MRVLETLTLRRLAMALAVTGLAGCATSALDLAPPAPDQPWQPRLDAAGGIVPGASTGAASAYVLPAGAVALPEPPALTPGHAYTLPELIDLAQSSNPLTRIAWNDARNAALAAGIAKSVYLPQLTAVAMGGYHEARGSTPTPLGPVSTDTSGSGTLSALSLQWLLFDFGNQSRVAAASQASVAANVGFTAAHQQVIYDVSMAYYAYEAAQARTRSALAGLANADAILVAARARFRQGAGTVIEVSQAAQNRAQANLLKVQSEGTESDSYLALVSALGISPLSRLTVSGLPERSLSPALIRPVEQVVAEAVARRPDVRAAYALAKAGTARVEMARSAFMPKVFMSASTAYGSGRAGITTIPPVGDLSASLSPSGSRHDNGVFMGVTIPLYDGGRRAALLAQARGDADSAAVRLGRVREEAVRQIVVSQNALRTSLASQEAAQALLEASQTSYDAAFAAYRHGVGSITDTLRTQNQLLAARSSCADSRSAVLSAAATLALATGVIGGEPVTEVMQ
ncbi:MAG: TolC family protein [Perlucidibaca sp.]